MIIFIVIKNCLTFNHPFAFCLRRVPGKDREFFVATVGKTQDIIGWELRNLGRKLPSRWRESLQLLHFTPHPRLFQLRRLIFLGFDFVEETSVREKSMTQRLLQ